MFEMDHPRCRITGPQRALPVLPDDDEITRQRAMLLKGPCQGLGATRAARKDGQWLRVPP